MFLGKKAEASLESIAISLKTLVGLMESQTSPAGTSLRTNYTDGRPDASYFSEVDDATEFLRDLEDAARVAQGLPPNGNPSDDENA